MKRTVWSGCVALLLLTAIAVPAVQGLAHERKGPVTSELPSGVQYGRQPWADSTLNGGTADGVPSAGAVKLPDPCAFDPKRCEPSSGSGGSGVTPPPVVTPPPTSTPSGEWCGMPADYVLNQDPACAKVQGGWRCTRKGGTVMNYRCP